MSDFDITQGGGTTIRAFDPGDGKLVQAITPMATVASDGGVLVARYLSANSTNATNVWNLPSKLYGFDFYNTNAAARWLKFYNKASAPTVGSDTPVMTVGLKPGDHSRLMIDYGVYFSLGLSFCFTTGVADSDTGAVAANEITGHIFWI